jgi:hypothetical protein
MSIPIVQHVWQKSQTQGSARTLLLTLAIHANDCCGVAWVSDTTLRHEVNVSRQRIHELKNILKASGELTIIERPGYTNLYFVAWQGQAVGGQGSYRAAPGSTHEPGCPLRKGTPAMPGGVSGPSDTQVSGPSDRGCQDALTQKTRENDTENKAPQVPFSLSPKDGPHRPEGQPVALEQPVTLTPADLKRLGLTPGSTVWRALLDNGETEGGCDHQGKPLILPS